MLYMYEEAGSTEVDTMKSPPRKMIAAQCNSYNAYERDFQYIGREIYGSAVFMVFKLAAYDEKCEDFFIFKNKSRMDKSVFFSLRNKTQLSGQRIATADWEAPKGMPLSRARSEGLYRVKLLIKGRGGIVDVFTFRMDMNYLPYPGRPLTELGQPHDDDPFFTGKNRRKGWIMEGEAGVPTNESDYLRREELRIERCRAAFRNSAR